MQGKKYDAATKEQALAMLAVSTSIQEVSDKLQIPFSTLKTWKDAAEKNNDEFVKLRNEKKKAFIDDAWDIISDANKLMKIKLRRALTQEENLDAALEEMEDSMDWEDKKERAKRLNVINKINSLKIENVGSLASIAGTMYDKQALANNEKTMNIGVESLESLIKKVEGDSAY